MSFLSVDPNKDPLAAGGVVNTSLLFVDPGKELIGFCIMDPMGARQTTCGVFEFPHRVLLRQWLELRLAIGCTRAFCERPQVYQGPREEDPNDLIDVALTAGVVGAVFENTAYVRPHRWKGSKKKSIHQPQILKEVATRPDAALIQMQLDQVRKGLRHNAIDAVGIALWYFREEYVESSQGA